MSGDFNEKDISYEASVDFGKDNTFNLLNGKGKLFYDGIEQEIANQYSLNLKDKKKVLKKISELKYSADKKSFTLKDFQYQLIEYNQKMNFYKYRKKYLLNINSCLVCLNSFMYQSKKLENHNFELKKDIPDRDSSPVVLAKSSLEACTDFESLLYLARSALDRLTFFICKQIYKDGMENFNKKIINILKNFKKDYRSSLSITIFNNSIPHFQGLLIDKKEGGTSLRSLLAHSKSHSEAINGEFTVHRSDNFVLRFDQELEGYPLLQSSHLITQYLVYTVLNNLAIYLGIKEQISENNCIPNWTPCAIKSSVYRVDKDYPNSIPFTIPLFIPIGFIPDTHYFKKDILQYVEEVS